jgi:hypothetical protein
MPYNDPLFKLGESMTREKPKLNPRQICLKHLIDSGATPTIVDATFIYDSNEANIPFHWGDIEQLGYGSTSRAYCSTDNIVITRNYHGPGQILIKRSTSILMKRGDQVSDY